MVVRHLVVALLVASAWSCSSDDESPVRGNVHEVYRVSNYTMAIADVRRAGDRIGVLIIVDGDHLVLSLSEDRGTSWKSVEIEDTDYIRGGQVYIGATNIILTADLTQLLIPRSETGALGHEYSRSYVYTVDLATGSLGVGRQEGGPPIDLLNRRAFSIVPDEDPQSHQITLIAQDIDLILADNDHIASVGCGDPSCRGLKLRSFLGTDDGDHYHGMPAASAPDAECMVSFSRSELSFTSLCVPYAKWPGTADRVESDDLVSLPYAGQNDARLKAFNRNGHAWAATILPETGGSVSLGRPSEPVDLGPGRVINNSTFGGWPRFRGMAIVQAPVVVGITPSNLTTRIVRVPQTGLAQNVHLPVTPCEDDSKCGYRESEKGELIGQMTWTESLGGDEYLVFYRSDITASSDLHQESISVALEHATYEDIPGETLPLDGAVGYINSREMTGIAAMCARAMSCVYGMPDDLLVCMRYWSVVPAADAAQHHAALMRFLASPADCSSFANNPSAGFLGGCNGLEPNCSRTGGACDPSGGGGSGACVYAEPPANCNTCTPDGRAVNCAGSTVTSVYDCAAVGQACACTGSACACVPPPCADNTQSCVGDVLTSCSQTSDCSMTHQTCSLDFLTDPGYFPGCLPEALGPCPANVWCDDTFMMACVNGQPQAYNCATNGFSTCGVLQFASVPRCLP